MARRSISDPYFGVVEVISLMGSIVYKEYDLALVLRVDSKLTCRIHSIMLALLLDRSPLVLCAFLCTLVLCTKYVRIGNLRSSQSIDWFLKHMLKCTMKRRFLKLTNQYFLFLIHLFSLICIFISFF